MSGGRLCERVRGSLEDCLRLKGKIERKTETEMRTEETGR